MFLQAMRNPFVLMVLVFIIALNIFQLLQGPAVCRDGWQSASIGSRGACSHHGGVKPRWAGFAATIVALGVGIWRHLHNESKDRIRKPVMGSDLNPPTPATPITVAERENIIATLNSDVTATKNTSVAQDHIASELDKMAKRRKRK